MSATTEPAPLTFTAARAAKYVGIGERTLYRLRDMGRFPAPVSVPGTSAKRYRRADLEKYVANLKTSRG